MMATGPTYSFGTYRLDIQERRLLSGETAVPLRGKAFDTLAVLVQNHGRLLRKEDLMRAVWPDSIVEENNLDQNVSVLRKLLGQSSRGETYIETVPRQGYRFVAAVEVITLGAEPPIALSPAASLSPMLVQRQSELDFLRTQMLSALSGRRRVVFITGEPGAGKTTLVRAFLRRVAADSSAGICVGEGQCIGSLGEGEPYLPFLEAAAQLARASVGTPFIDILKRHAPSWLLQMPSLADSLELTRIRDTLIGTTRERMLREMVEALEAFAAERAIVIVLEDLQWADNSTLELLSRLARGNTPAHLLVLATHRAAQQGGTHPRGLAEEFTLRDYADEVALSSLTEESIAKYLAAQFGTAPPELAALLHRRTEGNPLFLNAIVSSWAKRGYLQPSSTGCRLEVPVSELEEDLPDSLRHFIERQLEQLIAEELQIIEVAAVAGTEFCSALLAAVLEWSDEKAESVAASLARRAQLICRDRIQEWPDGTVSDGFRFVHSLYREVVYDVVPAGRRVRYHQQLGRRLESAFAGCEDAVAAQLALHFSEARDADRGLRYSRRAAELALQGSGYPEAVFHIHRALALIHRLPELGDRNREELRLQSMLAPTLVAIFGFAHPEAEAAFRRAAELAALSSEPKLRFPAIVGLATMLEARGEFRGSQALLQEYLPEQEKTGEFVVDGLDLLSCSLFHQGCFRDALGHATRGAAERAGALPLNARYGEHPVVGCETWAALSSWFLGYPDQALDRARRATEMADHPANLYSLAGALLQQAMLHQLRREPEQCRQCAERALQLARKQGFGYREAVAIVLRGWAMAQLGEPTEGLAALEEGLTRCRGVGAELDRPYYLALLAEVLLDEKRVDEAFTNITEAINNIRSGSTFYYEAELWRIHGVISAKMHNPIPDHLLKAFNLAQAQQARSLQLRAAMSLTELSNSPGEAQRAGELVAETYGWFAEGFRCADLIAAHKLLEHFHWGKNRKRGTRLSA